MEESPEFHGFERAAGSSKSKSIDDVGLVGPGAASRVFTFHLLDILTASTPYTNMPHMTSCSNSLLSIEI